MNVSRFLSSLRPVRALKSLLSAASGSSAPSAVLSGLSPALPPLRPVAVRPDFGGGMVSAPTAAASAAAAPAGNGLELLGRLLGWAGKPARSAAELAAVAAEVRNTAPGAVQRLKATVPAAGRVAVPAAASGALISDGEIQALKKRLGIVGRVPSSAPAAVSGGASPAGLRGGAVSAAAEMASIAERIKTADAREAGLLALRMKTLRGLSAA